MKFMDSIPLLPKAYLDFSKPYTYNWNNPQPTTKKDNQPLLPTSFFMDCLNISKNSDEVFWNLKPS
jgi:hypothetical protein